MRLDTIAIISLLALGVSPASANWFDAIQAGANHKKLPGSASSPTPDDLRALGDSKLGKDKNYAYSERDGHWHEVRPDQDRKGEVLPASGSASTATIAVSTDKIPPPVAAGH